MKKAISALTAIVIAAATALAPFTEAAAYVEYTTGQHQVAPAELNVRRSPVNGDVFDTLHRGEIVSIVDVSGNWGRLSSGGWMCLDYMDCVAHYADLSIEAPVSVEADDDKKAIIEFEYKGMGIARIEATCNRAVKGLWRYVNWEAYPNYCSARLELFDVLDGETEIYLRLIGENNEVIFYRTITVRSGSALSSPSVEEQYEKNVPVVAKEHIGNTYRSYLKKVTNWCGYSARKIACEALMKTGSYTEAEARAAIGWRYLTGAVTAAWAYPSKQIGQSYCFLPWTIDPYYSYAAEQKIAPSGVVNMDSRNFKPRPGDFILTETNEVLSDGPDHVALIISVSDDSSSFTAIEGNTGAGETADTRTVKYRTYERVAITIDGKIYYTYRRTDCSGILCSVTNVFRPAI